MADCRQCGTALIYDEELDSDYCERCIDILIERTRQRDEWNACHDEACPEVELTPLPKLAEAG